MKRIARAIRQVWRLASPYFFKSRERFSAWMLVVADLAIMGLTVSASVRMNKWFGDWTNAYTNVDYQLWVRQLIVFLAVGAVMIIAATLGAYLQSWLLVRWRRWMTSEYLDNWMHDHNHYRMQITKNSTDNPDQRISEDINTFLTNTLAYTLQLLQQLLTLGSFLVILWNLSNSIPLYIGGRDFSFPGYFIVIAFVWAVLGTFCVHAIGKPLIRLGYMQQRYEADFRFALVRVRENSEQIALLGGEPVEHGNLMGVFGNVVANTFRTMLRTAKHSLVSLSYAQLDGLIISLLLGPSYFLGMLPGGYGAIMQVSQAFQTVLTTFKFFQTAYVGLAAWKACINRLYGFLEDAERTAKIVDESKIHIHKQDSDEIDIDHLAVDLPDGSLLITADNITFRQGERILIKGRSGSGKTTLFRVLAGIWPYGEGDIRIPKDKKVILLPQRPYIPIGTLEEAISYPEAVGTYSHERLVTVLREVGLDTFTERLNEVAHWNQMLSGGEQQRIGIARALLYNPDYLFFDEATASMDEPSEEELYTLLVDQLKNTTIISIGHRSSLQKFHDRLIVTARQDDGNMALVDQSTARSC